MVIVVLRHKVLHYNPICGLCNYGYFQSHDAKDILFPEMYTAHFQIIASGNKYNYSTIRICRGMLLQGLKYTFILPKRLTAVSIMLGISLQTCYFKLFFTF